MTAHKVIAGADRQVDAAGDDHEGDAERQHAVDRRGDQDADELSVLQEVRATTEKKTSRIDEGGEGEQLLEPTPPVASARTRRWVLRRRLAMQIAPAPR